MLDRQIDNIQVCDVDLTRSDHVTLNKQQPMLHMSVVKNFTLAREVNVPVVPVLVPPQ